MALYNTRPIDHSNYGWTCETPSINDLQSSGTVYEELAVPFLPFHLNSGPAESPTRPPKKAALRNHRELTRSPFELNETQLGLGERKIRAACGIQYGIALCLDNYPDVPLVKPPVLNLIMLAIWQSPQKRLTLAGIREAILKRYPYLAGVDSWKDSLRNALTNRVAFRKMASPDGRKGCLWTFALDDESDLVRPLQKTIKTPKSSREVTRYKPFEAHGRPGAALPLHQGLHEYIFSSTFSISQPFGFQNHLNVSPFIPPYYPDNEHCHFQPSYPPPPYVASDGVMLASASDMSCFGC